MKKLIMTLFITIIFLIGMLIGGCSTSNNATKAKTPDSNGGINEINRQAN